MACAGRPLIQRRLLGHIAYEPMIRKRSALGLDPRVEAGFPKRSCSSKAGRGDGTQSD
jgi:hypothetical protein